MRNIGERIFSAVHLRNQYFIRTVAQVIAFFVTFVDSRKENLPGLTQIFLVGQKLLFKVKFFCSADD